MSEKDQSPGRTREKLVRELQGRVGKLAGKLPETARKRIPEGLLQDAESADQDAAPASGLDEPVQPAFDVDEQPAALPEVAEIEEEPRRASSRIRVPHSFCFVDENGRPVRLELTLIIGGPVPELASCFLFDINESGVGFVTTEILTVGEHVTLCVTQDGDPEPLVAVEVEVLNQRDFAGDKSHLPERFANQPSWIYGVRMDEDSLGTLMCATLESLELDGEEMETDQRLALNRAPPRRPS